MRCGFSPNTADKTPVTECRFRRNFDPLILGFTARLEDHSLPSFAVHQDRDGLVEVQQAYASVVLSSRLFTQPIPVNKTLACVGIHREIADAKRRQVLKEMTAL